RYFAMLPASDITADAIAQRTRAHLKLGAVRRDQGRHDQAIESFNAALTDSQDLLRRDPQNVEYETIEAESLSWLGLVDWSQGRLENALERFIAARNTLLDVASRRRDDSNLIDRIGSARTNVGRIFE